MGRPKELQNPKTISLKVDGSLREVAHQKAQQEGQTLSNVLRFLLLRWLCEDPALQPPPK